MSYPIKLEECTWKDVELALKEGYDTVIIPSGSVEQHGPHLPLITDAEIGESGCGRDSDDAVSTPRFGANGSS